MIAIENLSGLQAYIEKNDKELNKSSTLSEEDIKFELIKGLRDF